MKKKMKARGVKAGKMKARALKKGGGAKLGRGGAKLGPAGPSAPPPPRPTAGALGAAGTKLGGDKRKRALEKRLQGSQL
jgi:hypothetical protein